MLQVAAQEGAYLADCFNRMNTCEENPEGPLRIRGAGRHRFKPFRSVIKCDALTSGTSENRICMLLLFAVKVD
jgi:hypothetical protein